MRVQLHASNAEAYIDSSKTWKTSLWASFGRKTSNKVFPEKNYDSILKLYAAFTGKISEKFNALIFDNT